MSGRTKANDQGTRDKYNWTWTILGPWDAPNRGMLGIKLIPVTFLTTLSMAGKTTAHNHGTRVRNSWVWTILGPWNSLNIGVWGTKLILVTS